MPKSKTSNSQDWGEFNQSFTTSFHIVLHAAYWRAFLAQRRGHGRAVARKLLIRAGGLKTCWTKPQGTAVPQLWALQLGEEDLSGCGAA